jgi:hypothetical protein
MNTQRFIPKKGQIVLAQGHNITTFKVLDVSEDGYFADIQPFSLSKQTLMDGIFIKVPCSTLIPHQEDASQAAARIVKEATRNS